MTMLQDKIKMKWRKTKKSRSNRQKMRMRMETDVHGDDATGRTKSVDAMAIRHIYRRIQKQTYIETRT